MRLTLESSAFQHHAWIPDLYTCKGDNISPPLNWHGAPKDTQSFALIMDDPDAPNETWVHWILFNIPANQTQLEENANLPPGASTGLNTWVEHGYGGPCPPSDTHRYFFKLYALDTKLSFKIPVHKEKLLHAMHGHILDQCELIGIYGV
jgi:Raf kinase inhibitor-like YbhB/YbcL family protein